MDQVKLIKNSFVSPVQSCEGVDFSNDLIEVYELMDHVIPGPSGEDTDFVVVKKPVLVDSYHLNKVIAERSKGNSLKEIVAQCERTGDMSALSSNKHVYFDSTILPMNLSDALEKGKESEAYLDSLSNEEKENLISLSKMSKGEFDAYINDIVKAQLEGAEKKGE